MKPPPIPRTIWLGVQPVFRESLQSGQGVEQWFGRSPLLHQPIASEYLPRLGADQRECRQSPRSKELLEGYKCLPYDNLTHRTKHSLYANFCIINIYSTCRFITSRSWCIVRRKRFRIIIRFSNNSICKSHIRNREISIQEK